MTLKLEYSCTETELKEAQMLNSRQVYGGGSKWRARAAYWAFIALAAVALFYRFKTEIAPKDRWWFITLVVVILVALQIFKRMTRSKTGGAVQLEVSESGLVFRGGGHTTMAWTAFSGCLESPALFVLVSRSKSNLYLVPKRAFPDEAAQNWFRTLATQPPSPMAAAGETISPGQFATKGITLTVHMGFWDHLIRLVTSWRMKGIALGMLLLTVGLCLFMPDPPHPVNSREKTLVIMLAIMIPMILALAPFIALIAWGSERKFRIPQHVALSHEGIEFASGGASGVLPWSTYQYYLENRWAFFIWQGPSWFMMPKRAFASQTDMEQCRELLRTNLKFSRWFYM